MLGMDSAMRARMVFASAFLVLSLVGGLSARAESPFDAADEMSTGSAIVVLRTPGPESVLIREGSFMMGSTLDEMVIARKMCESEPWGRVCPEPAFADEYPPHEVYLSDVWLDRTEVTVAQYRRCVSSGKCLEPPYASGAQRFDRPELPVVMVNWYDATAYCQWAGGRLPTEAEWERAAKGIRNRRFPWGNVWNNANLNHGKLSWDELDGSDGFLELAPVGQFPNGRTPDGFDDLGGNVEEWVSDYYFHQYPNGSLINPKGPPNGDTRVVRGGSYAHGRPSMRTTARQQAIAASRLPYRGFRCARDP